MPEIEKSIVPKAEIYKLKIPPGSRKVLIKTLERNVDARTASGIWKISPTDTDWDAAVHADRWGEVIQVPRDPLPFIVKKRGERGQDLMPWQTKVEIGRGMKVWYDYLASLNTIMYVDEDGSEYRLIDYADLYVATILIPTWYTDDEKKEMGLQVSKDGTEYIIPLNGYHIFEQVYKEKRGDFDYFSDKMIDNRYGIVKYVATNNTAYENGMDEDHVVLKRGDKVRFGPVPAVTIEDEFHCKFDSSTMYRRAQARNVDQVWRDGELILPKGRLLLKQIEDKKEYASNIVLPISYYNKRSDLRNHKGEVLVSSVPEAKLGDTVLYIMGAGALIDYKGEECRIVKESEILYVL